MEKITMKKICILCVLFAVFNLVAGEIQIPMDVSAWRITGGKVESVTLDGVPAFKITGQATLELLTAYTVDVAKQYRMRGEFNSPAGISRFGVRCFDANDNIVREIISKGERYAKTLRLPCRAEDCDLYVNDVKNLRRQYGLYLIVGEEWIEADVGRFFTDSKGGVITLYAPVGRTLPAGTKVMFGYRSSADIYFGGVLRGTGVWRGFDCTTMKGMHNLDFHQRRLHPETKKVRILVKANENAAPDTVMYLRNLYFIIPD